MLSTELRERSRIFRDAARKAEDAGVRRRLAAHALTLAQAAEAVDRGTESAQQLKYYASLLTRRVDEVMPPAAPGPSQTAPVAPADIRAWRLRAEELRATAEQFVVPSAQDALRRAAANYEELADQAEALMARRPRAPGKKTG